MLLDVAKAKIVLTNYHAFKRREVMELTKVGRAFLQGRDAPIQTTETEGASGSRRSGVGSRAPGSRSVLLILRLPKNPHPTPTPHPRFTARRTLPRSVHYGSGRVCRS